MQIPRVVRAIVLLTSFCGTAAADIIVWRDNSGVSHYTNDISNVPAEYRGEAMIVAKEWARARPGKGASAVTAAATSVDAEAGAAPMSRKAYGTGYRGGQRGETASSAGFVADEQGDESETPSAAGGSRRTAVPEVAEGHRPRRSDHRDNRDSQMHESAESASEP
jgi:hypothetical protein